jgi:hypothetical protein
MVNRMMRTADKASAFTRIALYSGQLRSLPHGSPAGTYNADDINRLSREIDPTF